MADKSKSRFWADSDSSDSDSEGSSSGSDDSSVKASANKKWAIDDYSSSGDDEQRVVKSSTTKAKEAFQKEYKNLQNAVNVSDFNTMLSIFSSLDSLVSKHSEALRGKDNSDLSKYPLEYFHIFKLLDLTVKENQQNKKKLSKTNSRSLNILRSRLKKKLVGDLLEEVENVADLVEEASESSDDSDSSSSGSDDSSSSSEEETKTKKKAGFGGLKADSDESSDDSDSEWGSSSDSDSDEDEGNQLTGRARWVKRAPETKEQKEKKLELKKQREQEKQNRAKQRKDEKELKSGQKEEKKEEEVLTEELVDEKVQSLVSERGKKSADAVTLAQKMRDLYTLVLEWNKSREEKEGNVISEKAVIQIFQWVVTLQFDIRVSLDEAMSVELWNQLMQDLDVLMTWKEEGKIGSEYDISSFVDRMNTEYIKSLRYMEDHSDEYVTRLKDELQVVDLANRLLTFYSSQDDVSQKIAEKASLMALLLLQNSYYKPRAVLLAFRKDVDSDYDFTQEFISRTKFICQKAPTQEMTIQAILCLIFHLSLFDKYSEAKEWILLSKVQDTISQFEISTQILFNRAMAQFGVCAFKIGKIAQAHQCLVELCQVNPIKVKELLAQGVFWKRYSDNQNSKVMLALQKEERRRILPYHMHLNTDLLEFCFLVSAMLLETPNMAKFAAENFTDVQLLKYSSRFNHRVISRHYRRLLEKYEKQDFTGPPEGVREHCLAASLALQQADWRQCSEYLLEVPVWNFFRNKEKAQEMLLKQIKKEALRTFMLTYSSAYESIDEQYLIQKFELGKGEVHKIINGMIVDDDIRLKASWDQVTSCLLLHRSDPTHLQALGMQFSDKLGALVGSNESLMSNVFGGVATTMKNNRA
eukprot:augustus_masked-scaffold_22-processed-gene-1.41-mRNA-1 protein AED:0.31 eAED:0.34 QI:0/-1/0/1/-1/1/1/0/867